MPGMELKVNSLWGAVDIIVSCGYYTMILWKNYGVLGILICGVLFSLYMSN
jgi:hypothetical protein